MAGRLGPDSRCWFSRRATATAIRLSVSSSSDKLAGMKTATSVVTYDAEADMARVRVSEIVAGESKRQVVIRDPLLPSVIVVDLDRDGRILGFELFDGSKSLPLKLLDAFQAAPS
jgi:uncharacterized protein YuzE